MTLTNHLTGKGAWARIMLDLTLNPIGTDASIVTEKEPLTKEEHLFLRLGFEANKVSILANALEYLGAELCAAAKDLRDKEVKE